MKPEELAAVRERLEGFAEDVFGSVPRADQRRKAGLYLRGLLLEGRRKSVQPMAARLAAAGDGDVEDLRQALQQFVTSSPWEEAPVRARLARRSVAAVAGAARRKRPPAPVAWAVDDTGFPKFGRMSVGVARQYSGTLGKVGNCQVGVSVHVAADDASCPVDWRLFLPAEWDPGLAPDDEARANAVARRTRTHVPDEVHHRPKWQLVLDMLDELAGWELPVAGVGALPVVADAGYGSSADFRTALEARGLAYVVGISQVVTAQPAGAELAQPAYSGRGRPPVPGYPDPPRSLRDLAVEAVAGNARLLRPVVWRRGSRGWRPAKWCSSVDGPPVGWATA